MAEFLVEFAHRYGGENRPAASLVLSNMGIAIFPWGARRAMRSGHVSSRQAGNLAWQEIISEIPKRNVDL